IGQIHRSATQSTDSVSLVQKLLDDVEIVVAFVKMIVGKPGGQQAFAKGGNCRYPYDIAVEIGGTVLMCMVALALTDVVDHAENRFTTVGEPDADGIQGNTVKEVGGAVQRVDDPVEFMLLGLLDGSFLRDE